MKKTLLVITALVAAVGVMAQGTINPSNDGFTLGYNAPILNVDGTPLQGAAYLAQIYAGPQGGALAPVGVALPFIDDAGGFAEFEGVFLGADPVQVAGVAGGATASLQVRAWIAADGATYDAALASSGIVGTSNTFDLVLGGGGNPPALPAAMVGLQSFSLVPEPSAAALGLLGAVALMLRRRK
jgi:hypothetical protein